MEVIIQLTPEEIACAAAVAVERQVRKLRNDSMPAYGAGHDNDWQLGIEGCLGELALCKYFGVFWSGLGAINAPDVGYAYDVRTTSWPDGCLILHDDDPDNRPFYLLVGVNGRYAIKGWLLGVDGKRREFWRDKGNGRPAYFVPQSALQVP